MKLGHFVQWILKYGYFKEQYYIFRKRKREFKMYDNLNAEIARKGLKKSQLAEFLSISTSAQRLKITGVKRFTLDEAFKIVEILGGDLSVEYLFQKGKSNE